MASSYPPPPTSADSATPASDPQTPLAPPISPHHAPPHPYDGLPSPSTQAAVDAAHHGLQVLQAATAAPGPIAGPGSSPGASPYPALPSPHAPHSVSPHGSDGHSQFSPRNSTSGPSQRQTRLRRACDMCSARKVKCDEAGPPCRPCSSLGVECTFSREMKRRGPPNKHLEAAKSGKRVRLEPNMSPSPHNAAETLVSIAGAQRPLDGEAIAPLNILTRLVDDFFTYIHPLTPFPHEPSFRQSFSNREDQTDPEFLALLAGMIGYLVASFPRSARFHLKSHHSTNLFPTAVTMIDKCRSVALEARGAMFYQRDKTVYDAATSYFLGIAAGYTFQWKLCRRFFAESLSFVQELGYNRRRDPSQQLSALQLEYAPRDQGPFNNIDDQMGKRVFWVMLLSIRSMTQLGASANEIVFPPPTEANPYPDRPIEVDDACIFPDQIISQPAGTVSLMTGFNKVIDIYLTMSPVVAVELAYGITQLDWPDQKSMLNGCVESVKQTMERLPPELSLNLDAGSAEGPDAGRPDQGVPVPSTEYFDDLPGFQYYPPGDSVPENDLRLVIESQPERRRQIQFDIQKSNIYASHLATRSYYVEMYLNLRDTARAKGQLSYPPKAGTSNGEMTDAPLADAGDPIDERVAAEREMIVQNLLVVLASIPQRNMEPNGGALVNKIRQVASTLINDAPERKGPVAMRAEEYLGRFVQILMRLEKSGDGGSGGGGTGNGDPGPLDSPDDDEELRVWADLREQQLRFAQSGGFLGRPQ